MFILWGYSSIQTTTGTKFLKTQTFREHCSPKPSEGYTQGEQYTYTEEDGYLQVKKLDLRKKEKKINFTGTLILENCEKIPFCCLSQPAGSILLQQPWSTNTHCIPQMTKKKSTIKFTEKTRGIMITLGAATREGKYVNVHYSVCGGYLCCQMCHKATTSICLLVSWQLKSRAMNSNSSGSFASWMLAMFVTWPRLSYELMHSLEEKWKPTVILLLCMCGGDLCSYIIHKELFENVSHLRMEGRAESWSQEAEKGSPV